VKKLYHKSKSGVKSKLKAKKCLVLHELHAAVVNEEKKAKTSVVKPKTSKDYLKVAAKFTKLVKKALKAAQKTHKKNKVARLLLKAGVTTMSTRTPCKKK